MNWPLTGRSSDLDHALALVVAGTGVAILGSAGVGKSRVLGELADRAERGGTRVVRAVATESMRSIPFAPFVELLPDPPARDQQEMLITAMAVLQASSGQRGCLVVIDDAHHLDKASLAFLTGVVSAGVATVALTARSGEWMPPDLVDLWTNGVIERMDLYALDRKESIALLRARLGKIDSEVEEMVWELAQGFPLVVHELIEGSIGRSLIQRNGTWALNGQLTESSRVADLVSSRLNHLKPELRSVMELVAIGAPVPLETLLLAAGTDLGELETQAHIKLIDTGGEISVVPGHPLYGEILAANLGKLRKREALQRLVAASLRRQKLKDPLTAAVWQRDSGALLSQDLALSGAHEALVRHDPSLAEGLIEPFGTDDDRSALVLSRALSYQHRFAEAEAILKNLGPADSTIAGEAASVRAFNLAFGLGRIAEARDLLETAAGRVTDGQLRARLNNERGLVSAMRGDFSDAISASQVVLADVDSGDVPRTAAYANLTVALGMIGDCDAFDAIIEDAIAVADRVQAQLPFGSHQINVMRVMNLLNGGLISEAIDLATAMTSQLDDSTAMVSTWFSALVLALDSGGRLTAATESAREALRLFGKADPFGLEAQARGALALVRAQQGDRDAGESLMDLVLPAPAPRLTVWVERGRAWSALSSGDPIDGAVETLRSAGVHAALHEHYAWATFCFHDAVRLGRPDAVVDEIARLPEMPGAMLISAMRQHTNALVKGVPEEVASAAGRFAEMGALLLAAEVWAQAADLSGQDRSVAGRFQVLSMVAEAACEQPRTPALTKRPAIVTSREAEIVLAAARGASSAEIAESTYISVRTVDNHLWSVYQKLRIGGRDELRSLLAPVESLLNAARIGSIRVDRPHSPLGPGKSH